MPRTVMCVVLFLCLLVGCGDEQFGLPDALALKGTLTDGGTLLTVEGIENGTGMIVVGFHPIIDGRTEEEVTSAMVGPDGAFEIPQGIDPGEYVVTVRQWEPYPQKDLLKGKFSAQKSKIKRTIDADTELTLDISNPEG